MKQIPLTHGKVAIVDDLDFDGLSKFKWYAQKVKDKWYARRGVRKGKKVEYILMHRQIAGVNGKKIVIKHLSNNTLDNRKSNLRAAYNYDDIICQPIHHAA